MAAEVEIAGDAFRLVLRVTGYERPFLDSGADANWLLDEVEFTVSSPGSFGGSHAVALCTEELAAEGKATA